MDPNTPYKAWAKPARGSNPLVVGREKLAADLAFHLGLPVCPVRITRQTSKHHPVLPEVVSLSYETLPSGKDWDQFKATQQEIEKLRSAFTALWVFHGWIAERDHRGAGWNLKGERLPGGKVRVSSFDYVQSLNDRWTPPAPPDRPPNYCWSRPDGVYANPDPLVACRIIDRIQDFTAEQLLAIVSALPPECMPPDQGAALARGLHDRGLRLQELLGLRS